MYHFYFSDSGSIFNIAISHNRKVQYVHLLSLGASGGSDGNGFDKSSKFIMYNEISSTSERIGAITSEHRNVVPVANK